MNPLERKPVREVDSKQWAPGASLVTFKDLGEGRQKIRTHIKVRSEETKELRDLFPGEIDTVGMKFCFFSSQVVDRAILKMMS